jgi:hypothetical protein
MNARVLALLAILFALLLAGCSFKAEGDSDDDDGDSDGGVSVGGEGDDDDKDSPGPGLLMVLATLGLAGLARRKLA